jgi:hypothetical protein
MNIPETLATLGTQDIGRATQTTQMTRGELMCSQRVGSSYLFQDTNHITHIIKSCRTSQYAMTQATQI